jgi:hypothetical protein
MSQDQANGQSQSTPKEKVYEFVIQTPQGGIKLNVPHSGMKQCPCGSILFKVSHHIAFVLPRGILNAQPIALKVEVNICEKCGREIVADDKTIADSMPEVGGGDGATTAEPSANPPSVIIQP